MRRRVCVLLLVLLLLPASNPEPYIDGWSIGGIPMAHVSEDGCRLIKNFEGLRLQAYRDPVGIWTIGYGHTLHSRPGMVITEEDAEELLRVDLARFEEGVENGLKRPANQDQFDAMVSLAFNIGLTAFRKSTLLRKFNAGDMVGAAAEFDRWIRAGNTVLPGLIRRRRAERAMFEGRGTATLASR